jgi:hypothetical protein
MASCDDDYGLLGDPAAQPPAQPAPPPQPAQGFCFVDATTAAGSGAGPFVPAQEEGNHSSDRGKASNHIKRRRDRPEELSDGGEYCSYISGAGGGGGRKARGSSSDYRKDREEWTDGAISSLLDAYTDRFEQLNRGNLRGRDWEDVAAAVTDSGGKSVEQCKNKIDNLKKRYKVECQRISGSASVSHWPWYKQMEQIIGNSSSPGTPKPLVATKDDKPGQQQQNSNKRWLISYIFAVIDLGIYFFSRYWGSNGSRDELMLTGAGTLLPALPPLPWFPVPE